MNDLMTKSFLSYVDLKKVASMEGDVEESDLEMGGQQLNPSDQQNLNQFFQEVDVIKANMESITTLLMDLQQLNQDTKSTHSAKLLRGLRDRIHSDVVTLLRTAKTIKARLESLDTSNTANRALYPEGTHVDRTRMAVTNGLRVKLRDTMNDFQALRNTIVLDHKQGLKRSYFNATGKEATEEEIDTMVSAANAQLTVFCGNPELDSENKERHEAVKDLQRSLKELHQVFLDMAVLVDAQGEQMDDIELNVTKATEFVTGGTDSLRSANAMKKKGGNLVYWVWSVVLILLLIGIIATFT